MFDYFPLSLYEICQLIPDSYSPVCLFLGYDRVYLPLRPVSDTPFFIPFYFAFYCVSTKLYKNWSIQLIRDGFYSVCLFIGYERVYLSLHKVADTPLHTQGGDFFCILLLPVDATVALFVGEAIC